MEFHNEYINTILGRSLHFALYLRGVACCSIPRYLKVWVDHMIFDSTIEWIEVGAPIEKRGLNTVVRFQFFLINISIMTS